jgi:CHAT domain-containing protein/tetratricopeptide (TPR) repeat protein
MQLTAAQQARLDEAKRLNKKVLHLYDQGKFGDAIPLAKQVLAIRNEILGEKHPDYANSLNYLALLYDEMGDYARAEPLYRQALEIRKDVLGKTHPAYANSLNNLALLYSGMGDYARAEPLLRQALEIRKDVLGEKHPDYALSLNNLAGLYRKTGDYTRAEPLYRQALEIRKDVLGEKHPDFSASLNDLALLYSKMGDYARAEPLYRQALEINKDALGEKHPNYALSLNNLAELYRKTGDYARAEPLLRQALEIRKDVLGEKHPDYASSLNNLASLYSATGDYARAEPLYRQALEVYKDALGEKHPDYALSLNNLAELYRKTGDFTRAEPLYRQAIEIKKNVLGEKHPSYAASLNNLALLYYAIGDYARAEPLYRQASEVYKDALGEKHPDYALSLNNLASLLYHGMGDYARAEPLYRQAMEIEKNVLGEKHPSYALSLNNLAFLYYAIGDYARAEPLADEAVRIQLEILEQTADAQSTRQQLAMLAAVRFMLDNLLSVSERTQNRELAWQRVLAWKGCVAARQRALHALADRPDLVPEWAKLQTATANLARLSRATPPPEQAETWRRNVSQLSREVETLQRDLAQQSTAYRQAKEPITLESVRTSLPDGAVLVDYLEYWHSEPPPKDRPGKLQGEGRLAAFLLRREGEVERFELGPIEPISAAIDVWRKSWGSGEEGPSAANTLREKLWAPLEPSLKDAKLVLLSPDGSLGKLPLGALPGEDPKRYLIEDFPIAMIGSPQELVWIADEPLNRKRAGNLLVLGDVDYQSRGASQPESQPAKDFDKLAGNHRSPAPRGTRDGLSFAPLPGTAGEIATIEKLYQDTFRDQGLLALEKQRATTAAVREAAPGYAYLHLATHGFFAPPEVRSALDRQLDVRQAGGEKFAISQSLSGYHPNLLSGLAFAGANRPGADDDGILTAQDVEALDLSGTRLVVLSACETGLGQVAGGEGLLGLQRAFAAAGARTVVASMWKIDDAVTRDLMERFYSNLWDKEMGKLEALREAQLWALKERGPRGLELLDKPEASKRLPPRYWAAFVLSGDWR